MTQKYLETLNAVIDDPDSTADEKANAFGEMDKVIRISKLSSDRVLLAEGKTTENIGVEGSVGMPFNVVFTKTSLLYRNLLARLQAWPPVRSGEKLSGPRTPFR